MLIWITCSGPTEFIWEKNYDLAGFLTAQREEEESPVIRSPVRPMKRGGRSIFLAPGRRAVDTAGMFFAGE